MRKLLNFYSSIIIISILFIFIVLTFQQLPRTFYQQDEWLAAGLVKALGFGVINFGLNPIQVLFAEGRPATQLLWVFFFKTFGFQTYPLALYSIGFHFVNSVLVFFIAYKILKSYFGAFIASSFFALNSVSHQVTSWYAASFGSQPTMFFILLSILLYLHYLSKSKRIYLILSYCFAILSVYFKEIGIFLFIMLPIVGIILGGKISLGRVIRSSLPFLAFIVLFVFYRVVDLFFFRTAHNSASVFLNSSSENILLTIFSRLILYPLTSLSLIFIPYPIATEIAFGLMRSYYPYIPENISRWDLIAQTAILDVAALLFSIVLGIVLTLVYIFKKNLRRPIIFSIVLYVFSILPFLVIGKTYAYMEPRYYHVTSMASGMILAIILMYLRGITKYKNVAAVVLLIVFLAYLRFHVGIIRHDIAVEVTKTTERMTFLATLRNGLPTIRSNTNIFYFTGDKSFIVKGNMTPFQHGFGYSVLALYYDSGKIPRQLLMDGYLFGLGEQGYKEIDGLKFGYFNNYEDLRNVFDNNDINFKDVHAFYYDSQKKKLKDITAEIQKELTED